MKSILLSIKPKYVELIASGQKTIEVRKTAPKEVPFKAYIYCCKAKPYLYKEANPPFELFLDSELYKGKGYDDRLFSGKVIGEFLCDRVERLEEHIEQGGLYYILSDTFNEQAQLDNWELHDYGKGKILYGWHISELKIYDRPKELSEFKKTKKLIARTCGMQARNGLCCAIDHEELCDNIKCCFKTPCPPQSWQYVEDLGEEE